MMDNKDCIEINCWLHLENSIIEEYAQNGTTIPSGTIHHPIFVFDDRNKNYSAVVRTTHPRNQDGKKIPHLKHRHKSKYPNCRLNEDGWLLSQLMIPRTDLEGHTQDCLEPMGNGLEDKVFKTFSGALPNNFERRR